MVEEEEEEKEEEEGGGRKFMWALCSVATCPSSTIRLPASMSPRIQLFALLTNNSMTTPMSKFMSIPEAGGAIERRHGELLRHHGHGIGQSKGGRSGLSARGL